MEYWRYTKKRFTGWWASNKNNIKDFLFIILALFGGIFLCFILPIVIIAPIYGTTIAGILVVILLAVLGVGGFFICDYLDYKEQQSNSYNKGENKA